MLPVRWGPVDLRGLRPHLLPTPLLRAQHSSSLCLPLLGSRSGFFKASWLCAVIFQTATLTWVRLSVLSSVGTSCAHREWSRGLEDTGRGLANGPKGNNLAEPGLEEGGSHASSWDPPTLEGSQRGSAGPHWKPRPACVGGRTTYRIIPLTPSS